MQNRFLQTDIKLQHAYLSYAESLILCLWPALLFLINGVVVLVLKTATAPAYFIILSPVFFLLASGWIWSRLRKEGYRRKFRDLLPVVLLPGLFAAWHFMQYGTSVGGDAASYFTNPFQTFFISGNFSFNQDPFIDFGVQPLANYWLPYNGEYLAAAFAALWSDDFRFASAVMHIASNYCIFLAILTLALRFTGIVPSLVISTALCFLLYGTHEHIRDLAATSVFRGFDNKGLIWGYFLWSLANIFVPPTGFNATRLFSITVGVVWAGGAFLVSGNALFLALPVIALMLSSLATQERKHVFMSGCAAIVTLCVCLIGYKFVESVDVYQVVLPNLRLRPPPDFTVLQSWFSIPIWIWVFAAAMIGLLALINLRFGIQLLIFCAIGLLIQSEMFFSLFNYVSPERSLNFWRGAILMTPLIPIYFAALHLVGVMKRQKIFLSSSLIVVCLVLVGFLQILTLPKRAPFGGRQPSVEKLEIVRACSGHSKVLADRHYGTLLAVMQPKLKQLVGKEYFLNWQIANLPANSKDRQRAEAVRDASLYLSKSPTTKSYLDDPSGLLKTLEFESPDIIIAQSKRLTRDELDVLKAYQSHTIGKTTVLYKDKHCQF